LYALSEMRTGDAYNMTDTQEAALMQAFQAGYYDTPREATLEEIAEELEISRQAVANRLRRGYRNLIGTTLMHGID
jgi:predicted DNA binding protein